MEKSERAEQDGLQDSCNDDKKVYDNGRGKDGLCLTGLATLPENTLLDEKALAKCLSVSSRTLRRMVWRRQIPSGVKLGGRHMWIVKKVLEHICGEADRLTAESKKSAMRLRAEGI